MAHSSLCCSIHQDWDEASKHCYYWKTKKVGSILGERKRAPSNVWIHIVNVYILLCRHAYIYIYIIIYIYIY